MKPNLVSVSSILPACSVLKDLKSGRAIHGIAVRHEMMENVFVCSALVNLYARCLSVKQARLVFDLMSHRDVVSWNGVLTAYFTNISYEKGLALFSQMKLHGMLLLGAAWKMGKQRRQWRCLARCKIWDLNLIRSQLVVSYQLALF